MKIKYGIFLVWIIAKEDKWIPMKKAVCVINLFMLIAVGKAHALTQRIYNHADEPISGKIIYRPVFNACSFESFEIQPGQLYDVKSLLCLIKEITVGEGPQESFLSGVALQGWNNTFYLTKSPKGSWKIDHVSGIH